MRIVSNKTLGLSMSVGALIAAFGLGVHTPVADLQAAPNPPMHVSTPPPSPPPPSTAASYAPSNPDYNPGADGGGGGGGGG